MNMRTRLNHKNFFFSLLIANAAIVAMDLPFPQLQLEQSSQKPFFCGKLFIDPQEDLSSYPYHICKANHPVEYLTQQYRRVYPHTAQFTKIPLRTPFIHVIIALDNAFLQGSKFFTVIPAHKLINCSDGSTIDIASGKCTFRLTCAKNDKLIVNQKYFPKDKQGNTFETQFLSCMHQFYANPPYCGDNPNVPELVQNGILQDHATQITQDDLFFAAMRTGNPLLLLRSPFTAHTYTHDVHGCLNSNDLTDLATKRTTKAYGSAFNFVMNRQHTPAKAQRQSINPAEARKVKCYYNYLENAKDVGNKSPMPKTAHSSKNPSLDVPNKIAMEAEETPDQEILDTILEDCLAEFAVQEKTAPTQQAFSRPSHKGDLIGNECVIL